ncbi:pentatricopeptide repeat-containing protein [Forsythia ovata]|uniref:Pentatricopeptide repeat-containing protein n=1 Tax=Forsythia ovata TaxID=205694 RepID=A0ABD1SLY3_9LAMI
MEKLAPIPDPKPYHILLQQPHQRPSLKKPMSRTDFLVKKLLHEKFPKSNTFTLAFLLKSCSILAALKEGQQIHRHVIASGFGSNLFVHPSLLNFYMKCEEVASGRIVFNEITEKNVVA